LFLLIEQHIDHPEPFIMFLADRLASHEICKRLRLVRPTFSESCRSMASAMKGDA
jgi:hypothetical protein